MGFSFDIPEDFMKEILECNSEEVCKEVLSAGVEPLVDSLKSGLDTHKETGELKKSIKKGTPFEDKGGNYAIYARPTGYDTNKVANKLKLIQLEYGNSHQAATPVLNASTKNAEKEVLDEMQKKYEEIIGGGEN